MYFEGKEDRICKEIKKKGAKKIKKMENKWQCSEFKPNQINNTLNANTLNISFKRQTLSDCTKK